MFVAALAATGLVHLLIGTVAIWSIKPSPVRDDNLSVTQVTLLPRLTPPPPLRQPQLRQRAIRPTPFSPTQQAGAPQAPPSPITQPAPASNEALASSGADRQALHDALQAITGCTDSHMARMSAAERERCSKRFRGLGPGMQTAAVRAENPATEAALQQEVHTNDVWRAYRHSRRLDDWPGWRNILGRAGNSLDPPKRQGDPGRSCVDQCRSVG